MKSFTLLCFLLLLLLLPSALAAQTTARIESWDDVIGGKIMPQLDAYIAHKSNERVGQFAWFFVGQHWSQAYAGVQLYPKKWMTVAAGAGLETNKNPWRIGGNVWMGTNKQSLLTILEMGGSGFWWRSTYNRRAGKHFGFGAMGQAHRGVGPRAQFAVPKTPVMLWATPFFNWNGKPTQAFGIVYNFN